VNRHDRCLSMPYRMTKHRGPSTKAVMASMQIVNESLVA